MYGDGEWVEGWWVNGVKMGEERGKQRTMESEAARQFANIREERKKRLSLREPEKEY